MRPRKECMQEAAEAQDPDGDSEQEDGDVEPSVAPIALEEAMQLDEDEIVLPEQERRKDPLRPGRIIAQMAIAPQAKIHPREGSAPP